MGGRRPQVICTLQQGDHTLSASSASRAGRSYRKSRFKALGQEGPSTTQNVVPPMGPGHQRHGYLARTAVTPGSPSAAGSGSGLPYSTASRCWVSVTR
jgi:hypothetical protein